MSSFLIWKILIYWVMLIFQRLIYFFTKRSYILNLLILSEVISIYWEAYKAQRDRYNFSKNSYFFLEGSLHGKCLPPIWIISLFVNPFFKWKCSPWKSNKCSLQLDHVSASPRPITLSMQRFMHISILLHSVFKVCMQDQVNKNNFYYFIKEFSNKTGFFPLFNSKSQQFLPSTALPPWCICQQFKKKQKRKHHLTKMVLPSQTPRSIHSTLRTATVRISRHQWSLLL